MHALAQRPWADDQFLQPEQVHRRIRHDRPRRRAGAPARGTHRAAAPVSAAVIAGSLSASLVRSAWLAGAARRTPRWTARRRRSGPAAGTSSRWPPRGPAGRPASPARPAGRSRPARACAASAPRSGRRRVAGEPVPGEPARAERQRDGHVGLLVHPAAISSEPPPMSSMSTLPEDQPNQRRAARNVSRASSWPDSTWMCAPVSSRISASTSSPLAASRTAEVANASSSSTPLSSAICSASPTKARSCSAPLVGQPAAVLQVITEPQLGLVGEDRGRPRAVVRVHDQEMHRIGADVQDTESHTLTLLGRRDCKHHDRARTGGADGEDRGPDPGRDGPQAGARLPGRRARRGHQAAGPGLGVAVLPGVLLPGRRRAGRAGAHRPDRALAEPRRRRRSATCCCPERPPPGGASATRTRRWPTLRDAGPAGLGQR